MPLQSTDPRTGDLFGPVLADDTPAELDAVVRVASDASEVWASTSPAARADALRSMADALDDAAAQLVPLADRETGLGQARLTGELARTTFQLRMFATAVAVGDYLGVVADGAVGGRPPAGHPELRRMLLPLGPVAVYGAGNFPFAFSVPGGDTASALAAGCTVVVKAHPAHPQTSEATASIMRRALQSAGAPDGTLGCVRGFDAGRLLVQHPLIRAAAFTGSYLGGRALFDLAVSRPDPIPFYGELGSVNPVIVTTEAARRGQTLASDYVDSLTLGTGQFCTNPSLLLLPAGSGLTELITDTAADRAATPMLTHGVAELFRANVDTVASVPGVQVLVDRSRPDLNGAWSGPVIMRADAHAALSSPELLDTECFGPAGLIIEYTNEEELLALVSSLHGCLVATLHASEDEPIATPLLRRLAAIAGRVVWNDWPTGVAVTAGQHHGGPHPATTSPLHTSVGTAAMTRFLRPIAFQSVPSGLLARALGSLHEGAFP